MSAYKSAIEYSAVTVQRRAVYFRNLIIVVALVTLISLVSAGVAWSTEPLAGTLLMIPVCGLFLILDERLVSHWRNELFGDWIRRELDFVALRVALTANHALPQNSIEGMLQTLPCVDDLAFEQEISHGTRSGISLIAKSLQSIQMHRLIRLVISYSVVSFVLIAAIILHSWQPMLGVLILGIVFPLSRYFEHGHLRKTTDQISALSRAADFQADKFSEISSTLDWKAGSPAQRKMLCELPN